MHECNISLGAHTLGKARCSTFSNRISNWDPDASMQFLQSLHKLCSQSNTTLADLDHITPAAFDNQYYLNLLSGEGLLGSDQVLLTGSDQTRGFIEAYAGDIGAFFEDFRRAMLKMGSLMLPNAQGEVRNNCRAVNQLDSSSPNN